MNNWQGKLKGIGATALMMLCAIAWTGASAQISSTRHNLGTSGPGPNQFSGTAEICVFCHTPHGGDTSADVPLWNRTLADPTTYTTYSTVNSSSIDGAVAPVGSVSIACLSCHDGTQAMDTILNEPGSGTDNPTFSAGTWSGANQTAGAISAGVITNIGQNLQNDHPIGIQYGGGGLTATAPAGALNDPDFVTPATADINGTQVWWVDTTAAGSTVGGREKTDMQLYTRSVAGIDAGVAQPFVECASCHDPHTANTTFLRISNDSSAVCLACHDK